MPIQYYNGDLIKSIAGMLVCPVNTRGVMGAGLALAFKNRWPEILEPYKAFCADGTFKPGDIRTVKIDDGHRLIVLMATKDHWRDPSRLGWVSAGLLVLTDLLRANQTLRVAIPAVGCGLGQLRWGLVHALIKEAVILTPETIWEVYPPKEEADVVAGRA